MTKDITELGDDDFGFSFVDELPKEEVTVEREVKVTDYAKLDGLRDMIMPLLLNLKNSNGDFIHWPTDIRVARIDKFINQIDEYITGTEEG